MEKIEEKYEATKVSYRASDGTVFQDAADCQNYEKSASCAIKMALMKYAISTENIASNIIPCASDGPIYGIIATDKDAMFAVRTFLKHYDNNKAAERFTDDYLGKKILIMGDEDESWFWWYSYDEIIQKMNTLFTPKPITAE